jgi:hypothetical protein
MAGVGGDSQSLPSSGMAFDLGSHRVDIATVK